MKVYNRTGFRIGIIFWLITIMPLTLIIIINVNSLEINYEKQMNEKNHIIVNSYKLLIDQTVQNVKQTTDQVAADFSAIDIAENSDHFYAALGATVDISKEISQMFYLDETGMQLYKTSGELGDRSDREYFQEAIAGESNFSNVIISRTNQKPISVYAVPVYQDNEIIGVLGTVIELDFLRQIILDSAKELEKHAFVVDRTGVLVAHKDEKLVTQQTSFQELEVVKLVLDGKTGSDIYSWEGKENFVSYTPLEITGWGLIISEPSEKVLKEVDSFQRKMVLFIVISSILSFSGVYLIYKYLTRPMKELESYLHEVEDGNLKVRVSSRILSRKDEIGMFARTQEEMLKSISHLIELNKKSTKEALEEVEKSKQLYEKLQMSHAQMDAIVSATEDGFFGYSIAHHKCTFSNNLEFLLGLSSICMKDGSLRFLNNFSEENAKLFYDAWAKLLSKEEQTALLELPYVLNDTLIYYRFSMQRYEDPIYGEDNIVISIKNITKEVKQGEKIREKYYLNAVTGLKNRYALIEVIDKYIEQGNSEFGILIFDLNGFKYVNSTFGHRIGDEILKETANILRKEKDLFIDIGHIESDRFGVLVNTEVNIEHLILSTNKKLSKIVYQESDFVLNSDAGIAYFREGDDGAKIIRNAEVALLEAKENERISYSFYKESYDDELTQRLGIMSYLKKALEYDEIYCMFQPIVDSKEKEIVGYETLTRWNSPMYGSVPPNVFIEIAESMGYIIDLGTFIIRTAFAFSSKINEGREKPAIVSINISPRQLYQTNFIKVFFEEMEKYELDARMIAVEITENVYMENLETAISALDILRERGIKVYLDDFGTGYSSLSYIQDLPIDVLKIDKSFVDKILEKDFRNNMLAVFMDISRRLELQIIAEGVETEEQLNILNELGCKYIQGYYYSKPLLEKVALEESSTLFEA